MHKDQKGFTLIELLVVVAILGILAAVVVPNVGKFIGSGKTEANSTEFKNVQLAVTALMADAETSTVSALSSWSQDISSVDAGTGSKHHTLSEYLNGASNMKCEYQITAAGSVSQCSSCTGC